VEVIEYDRPAFLEDLASSARGGYDVIYDTVTSMEDTNYEPIARPLLKHGRTYTAINGLLFDWVRTIVTSLGINVQREGFDLVMITPNTQNLDQLGEWTAQNIITLTQRVLPFTEDGLLNGFSLLKSSRTTGKITFKIVE